MNIWDAHKFSLPVAILLLNCVEMCVEDLDPLYPMFLLLGCLVRLCASGCIVDGALAVKLMCCWLKAHRLCEVCLAF